MVNRVRENVDPSELIPDERNANKGTERGSYLIAESLRDAGPGRSIVLDKDGRVIAGNKTLEAAIAAGLQVTVIPSHGESLIAHQRLDLSLDDPESPARKLAYLDNRSSEVSLEWDAEQLQRDHMEGVVDLTEFFWESELSAMGVDVETELSGSDHPKESYRPETMEPPTDDPVQTGQVYFCGGHQVIIGEVRKPGDAEVMLKAYEQFTGETCEIADAEDFL